MLLFLLSFILPAGMCLLIGVGLMFNLNFRYGPLLTLIAIPVAIGFLVFSAAEDFLNMYSAHMLIWLIGFLALDFVLMLIFGRLNMVGLTLHGCAFAVVLGLVLLGWMHLPKSVPDLEGTVRVEVQEIHQDMQAVTLDPVHYEPLLEIMEEAEMKGSFEELVEHDVLGRVYRFTCEDEKGEEIATFYLISNRHMMMKYMDRFFYFEADNGTRFPTDEAIEMFEQVVPPAWAEN